MTLLFLLMAPVAVLSQTNSPRAPASVTTAEIVRQLVEHNQNRAERLGSYSSERHYHLEYRGFPHAAEASMDVEATCDGPSSRSFHIVSQSGSRLLVDHVLKKLLAGEEEGAHDQSETALTPANYNFTLAGNVTENRRQLYVLKVEPKVARKLLYRGTIWVDAQDFAVVRIEAEPAQRLSFWVTNTEIHHVYSKTGGFWLPELDRSETKVRLGGTAILTIDYGTYTFARADNQGSPLAENASR